MSDEVVMKEIKDGAMRLNQMLELGLTYDRLVKTGGYKKVDDAGGFGGKIKRNENDFSFNYSQATFNEMKK